MARYSTSTSIYRILTGLPTSTATTNLIDQFADRTGGIIESYVGRYYDFSGWTSSSSTPESVQFWSDHIVAQLTMRAKFTADGQNRNDWVNELAAQSWADLEKVRDKQLQIFDPSGSEASLRSGSSNIRSTRDSFTPIFDVDTSTSWGVDSDLLDSISDNRS